MKNLDDIKATLINEYLQLKSVSCDLHKQINNICKELSILEKVQSIRNELICGIVGTRSSVEVTILAMILASMCDNFGDAVLKS